MQYTRKARRLPLLYPDLVPGTVWIPLAKRVQRSKLQDLGSAKRGLYDGVGVGPTPRKACVVIRMRSAAPASVKPFARLGIRPHLTSGNFVLMLPNAKDSATALRTAFQLASAGEVSRLGRPWGVHIWGLGSGGTGQGAVDRMAHSAQLVSSSVGSEIVHVM